MTEFTPKKRAQLSAEAMWRNDGASSWFGMRIEEIDEGYAKLSLLIEAHHCNGFGMCHGGVTFALADSAFAFACNSRNQRTVAQHNSITYLAPGEMGDILTATAKEVSMSGRSGIYDVKVTNSSGRVIAEFRGISRRVDGPVFDHPEAGAGEDNNERP